MGLLLEGLFLGDLVCLFEELQLRAGERLILTRESALFSLGGSLGLAEIQLGRCLCGMEFTVMALELVALQEECLAGRGVQGLRGSVTLQDLRHRTVVFQHLPIKLQTNIRKSPPSPPSFSSYFTIIPPLGRGNSSCGYNSGLSMRRVNESVQYDFERNTFYRIDKATGAESPTYKNGEDVKRFLPDITGHSYLIRRKSERVQAELEKPLLPKEKSFRTQRTIPHQYSYFKTLETSRRDSKPTEASVLMRSTINSHRDNPSPAQRRQNSLIRPREQESQERTPREEGSKALMNQTLTSYTKLLKEKPRENHSPRRDQYQGSQTARDPLDTLCTTLSNFKTKEPQWDQTSSPSRPERQARLSIQSSAKEASAKERSLFLQFHPELVVPPNPVRHQAQVQRKRNLKILQELFIRQGNRVTRKPYSNADTPPPSSSNT